MRVLRTRCRRLSPLSLEAVLRDTAAVGETWRWASERLYVAALQLQQPTRPGRPGSSLRTAFAAACRDLEVSGRVNGQNVRYSPQATIGVEAGTTLGAQHDLPTNCRSLMMDTLEKHGGEQELDIEAW